jgi:hypothetical protein
MTVPLDNLYHYVESQLNKPATVYLFYPHGSRKLTDLSILRHYTVEQTLVQPSIVCHDQEPLMFDLHQDHQPEYREALEKLTRDHKEMVGPDDWLFLPNLNLQLGTYIPGISVYDSTVLLHSELNSPEVEKYQQAGFTCAYYWCHAFISRDWFRFAQFDVRNRPTGTFDKMFLVYSRGWTNFREYRLKFIELLNQNNLLEHCNISMLKHEEGLAVKDYQFKNPDLEVTDRSVYDSIPQCEAPSSASADYDSADISSTIMSVVLETIYDGARIHLTEKTLRPIACGHAFVVAAAPGTLKYLRDYGFRTFAPYIDESYDEETDSVLRLEKICQAMKKISQLSGAELQSWYYAVREIAIYNRKHFFSDAFWNQITAELSTNLNAAVDQVHNTRGKKWLSNRKELRQLQPAHWQIQLQHRFEPIKARQLRALRLANIKQKGV